MLFSEQIADKARPDVKPFRKDDCGGQRETTRFTVDSNGALCVYAGDKILPMTAAETAELRAFLDATRNVTSKVERCL